MKENKKWSFFIVYPGSSNIKQIKVPHIMLILLTVFSILCVLGSAQFLYSVTTYGLARFVLYNKTKDNQNLLKIITFLNKLSDESDKKMKRFVSFEDNVRLKFGLNQINKEVRLAGIGGPASIEEILTASMEDPQVREANLLEKNVATLLRQIQIQDTTFSNMVNHVIMQNDRWAQSPSLWPCFGRVTSYFGERHHPFMETTMFHEGIDIANLLWTPVYATADGDVSFTGTKGNYGRTVILDHRKSGYSTVFAHLVKIETKDGQSVKRGELIGYLGNSGLTTGPHVHYEVHNLAKKVDPMKHILPMDEIVD